ncbi:hypothetical protein PsorP6_018795 [Peronosclerospora sorghi]|nr:hypothetical protein PsorP6_018795 [Peronosclerospora sorghi]
MISTNPKLIPADGGHSGEWKAHERYCSDRLKDRTIMECVVFYGVQNRSEPIDERFRGLGKTSRWSLNVIECETCVTLCCWCYGLCDPIDVARDLFFRQNENGEAVTLNGKVVSKNEIMNREKNTE